jgi:uncharacterized protein
MSRQDWREVLTRYIAEQARPIEKYGHQPRLYALTREVAAHSTPSLTPNLDYDDDVVFAAAWLHDLGVFTGHRPEDLALLACWDSTAYALEKSPAILLDIAFPAAKVPQVLEAIRTHQPAHDPQTLEAILLRDADILEQLGAVGILRTVCKVGRDTRFATFTQAVASLRQALDTLPQLLRLPASRTLAAPRVEALRAFLKSVASEAQGYLH